MSTDPEEVESARQQKDKRRTKQGKPNVTAKPDEGVQVTSIGRAKNTKTGPDGNQGGEQSGKPGRQKQPAQEPPGEGFPDRKPQPGRQRATEQHPASSQGGDMDSRDATANASGQRKQEAGKSSPSKGPARSAADLESDDRGKSIGKKKSRPGDADDLEDEANT